MKIRIIRGVLTIGAYCLMTLAGGAAAAEPENARWLALKSMLYQDREIHDASGVLSLHAPERAHDAAVVPVEISAEIPQTPQRYIKNITLLIDKNPSPMAGVFELTPQSGLATIATRVRVNEYTYMRAIAEMNDGQLFMASRFIKASGGCSAPSGKDQDAAMARLGKMKLRQLGEFVPNEPNRAQLLISHPNNTGLQMDQLTRHYMPAHFVREIVVRYDGEAIFGVKGDISLSEDPSIHFFYLPDGPGEFSVDVTDTDDNRFHGQWVVPEGAGT